MEELHNRRDWVEHVAGVSMMGDDEPTEPESEEQYFVKETVEDILQHVIDARDNYDDIRKKDTLFFKLVRGGNVSMVTQTLEYMTAHRLNDAMTWALSPDTEYRPESPRQEPTRSTGYTQARRLLRVVVFAVLWIVSVIVTPVFYILHATSCTLVSGFVGRISHNPDLPLLFAVLSENADMVRLFLQYGVSPRCTDRHGNTVYHYLADISAEDPDKFKRCHLLMKEAVDDSQHSLLTDSLANKENDMGLSPLEFLVHRGSIAVFIHLTREECCLGRLNVAVSFDQVTTQSADDRDAYLTCIRESLTRDGRKSVFVGQGSETAPYDGQNPIFLSRKADTKFQVTQWVFDVTKYEQKDIYGKQSLLLNLLTARSVQSMKHEDVSALMTSRFLKAWLALKKKRFLWCIFLKYAIGLFIAASLVWGTIIEGAFLTNPYPLLPSYIHELTVSMLRSQGSETINVTAELENCSLTRISLGGRNITGCEYDAVLRMNNTCKFGAVEDLIKYTVTAYEKKAYRNSLPVTKGEVVYRTTVCFAAAFLLVDLCQRTTFLVRNLFRKISLKAAVFGVLGQPMPGSPTDKILNFLLFSLLIYSYIRAKACVAYLAELVAVTLMKLAQVTADEAAPIIDEYIEQVNLILEMDSRLLCTCLLLCVVIALHAFRLIPKIGFFVLTSKKMGTHVLEFGIVYGFITVTFAVIFHFIMRDDQCPAKKMEGFESVAHSLFVVYTLSLGGDADSVFVQTHNVNAKLAFAVYTVISIMLLLNLIIAVMTTTADDLNRPPWKEALCTVEVWDEILGVEAMLLTIEKPLLSVIRWIRRTTGLDQSRLHQSRDDKVLIPVTYNS